MLLKTLLLTLFLHSQPTDSVPSLLSFHKDDIDTVIAAYKAKTITVKLKTGESYTYQHDQWRQINWDSVPPSIHDAMFVLDATFTKVEVPPSFPGGQKAWNAYLQKVCLDPANQPLITSEGPATVLVQFIVGFDGSVNDVRPITSDASQLLIELAVRIIKDGPAWVPATQNGHIVTAYNKLRVELK